ncbi:hypothetical protein GUITHDRAFT_75461 [Guillardia theta CCMP2712]|uniref:Peptidase M3A/M3B catalytic domain-containing protein n=1 Tax=Guillardia theta (strain CCMP2712) TaxID=905079 RepID=L1IXC5_GUITC|nr:hypothetical protein GUITHDRAFT_75461 [Guillardia theta CCMP2712]EKX40505.1 hypothetical protein GUITHDRAFT_75461 [Guillardia theta CCMP2712]|eukprot:XP_005827485.1 hypothetical protein GUITHDRAFT_75461 [Guillardia theta CCMP2712]
MDGAQTNRRIVTKPQVKTGLFGIKGLERPDDFPKKAKEAATKIVSLRDQVIESSSQIPAKQILTLMDEISDSLCLVIDAAELCRSVHEHSAWKEGAVEAYEILGDLISELNSDEKLYRALDSCVSNMGADGRAFDEEDVRMAWSLREEFERGGVHLDRAGRQEMIELQGRASALLYQFTCNQFDEADPQVSFPAPLSDALPVWMKGSQTSDGRTVISLNQDTLQGILQVVPDEDLRREAYISYHRQELRVRALEELLLVRHAIARKMKFSSFADYAISGKMAASPKVVEDFLNHLSEQLKHRAQQEIETLKKQKQHYLGLQSDSSPEIFPWDFPFYSRHCRNPEHELACKLIRNFLPLGRVLQGIGKLLENTFGICMREAELSEGEGWSREVKKLELTLSGTLSDEQVLKFPTDDRGLLGILYLDLIKRPAKLGGAAHFTIQCGRLMEDGHYRPPVLALVGNFSPPAHSQEPLLSFGELEMLLHEFGHALHSIVGRTRYQHLNGTRISMDVVEIPSSLMEYFARDPDFIQSFAKHNITGESIPKHILDCVLQENSRFSVLETVQQIIYALVDLHLHTHNNEVGNTRMDTSGWSRKVAYEATGEKRYIRYIEDCDWHASLSHLGMYGSNYYSYLWCKVIASFIWKHVFERNKSQPLAGLPLILKFLSHGGSKDPNEMIGELLEDVLHRKVDAPLAEVEIILIFSAENVMPAHSTR